MKGIFVTNRYYTDNGMKYIFDRLKVEAQQIGVSLALSPCPIATQEGVDLDCDFVIFWDKDYVTASYIEKNGIKVFNNSETIRICDDKKLTYLALSGSSCLIPTVFSPLRYDVNDQTDNELTEKAATLGYPLIAKECVGSQGRQVYLVNDYGELLSIEDKLKHTPHLYQKYVGDEKGADYRFYVAGSSVVGACKRINTTSFASNVSMGGHVEKYEYTKEEEKLALYIAKRLNMDFGSVDFIKGDKTYFVEANSNAYFKAIETLGINVAKKYMENIKLETLKFYSKTE